jgi:TIP49 AAA-lid domain
VSYDSFSLLDVHALIILPLLTRYALQLLAPAAVLAQVAGRQEVTLEDILETDSLFIDARRSARNLTSGRTANGGTNTAPAVAGGDVSMSL